MVTHSQGTVQVVRSVCWLEESLLSWAAHHLCTASDSVGLQGWVTNFISRFLCPPRDPQDLARPSVVVASTAHAEFQENSASVHRLSNPEHSQYCPSPEFRHNS